MPKIHIIRDNAVVGVGTEAQFRIACLLAFNVGDLRIPLADLIDRFNQHWAKLGNPQSIRPA